MKKIICCILVILMVVSFVGCTKKEENDNKIYKVCDGIELVEIREYEDFMIYVHKQTKVMYIKTNATYVGGISVMLDENGKPLLWEGEL